MFQHVARTLVVALTAVAGAAAVPLAAPFAAPAAAAGAPVVVGIDLRPGSTDRKVNMRGNAVLPVAILSTPGFDATTVVPTSVCFGDRDNALQRDCSEEHGTGHPGDVDGDGDTDLLLHFELAYAGLDAGDTRACLDGRTADGTVVYGCDTVEVANGTPEAELPDFAVSLVADQASVDAHATVTWTATVTNQGPGASTVWPGTALLRFTIPAGLAVSGVTGAAGYSCAAAGTGTYDCGPSAPDTIPVGAARTFVLTGVVPDVPGVLNLQADADPSGAVAELDEADNRADAAVDVVAANLVATLAAAPGAASPGEPLTWTATLANAGPGAARLAAGTEVLRFDVPAGLGGASVHAAPGYACTLSGSRYACVTTALTTLPAGGTPATFVLAAPAPSTPGTYEVVATADPAAALAETDEADNVAKAPVLVQLPNLLVSVAPTPEPVGAGEIFEWVVTVANTGPGRALVPAGGRVLVLRTSTDLDGVTVSGPAGFTCLPAAAREYVCTTDTALTLVAAETRTFRLRGSLPQGSHGADVSAVVDPAGLVVESDENDNTAAGSVVARLSDLAVTTTVTPNPVDAAHTVTWTAHVTNTGTQPIDLPSGLTFIRYTHPTGMLNLFASTPAGYTCFISAPLTVECATTAATTIPAGATLALALGGTAPRQPGDITTTATVDPSELVAESDETNNASSATVTVQPPNLSIALGVTPNPVDALAVSTWTARITNDGPAVARIPTGTRFVRMNVPAGMLNLAVSTPAGYTCFIEAPQVVDCQTTATQTIAVGGFVDITLFGTAPRQPGDITTTMTADPLGVIPERDELDNAVSATTTVQPPDLSMALTVSPNPVDALSTTTWVARIANDGPANARISTGTAMIRYVVPAGMLNLAVSTPAGFTCFISAPQTVDCDANVTTNLAAGAHLDFTLFGTAPRQPGPMSVTATADPDGAIPEVEETDNTASATVTVQPPDFSIALTATPDPVDALAVTTWVARITNDGPANARISTGTVLGRFVVPASMLNLAVSTPAGYTCFISAPQTVDCQTTATTNLAAGAHLDLTLFGTAPRQPGELGVTATADPANVIPEGDETDNTASASVTVQPPDFSVALTPSVTTVDAAHSMSWVARVTNDGPANARISNATVVTRFVVPAGLLNLAVSTPAGYTCFISAPQTVDCQTTATTNLAAGAHLDITLFGTAPRQPGPITVSATADPLNVIPEGDETDNTGSSTVNVQPPDFSVAMTAPASVAPGDPVSWTVTVANDGPAIARVSSATKLVRVTVPAGLSGASMTAPSGWACAALDATRFECNPTATTSIPVGGTVAFTLDGTAASAGTLTADAVADPLTVIPEADETDNDASASVTVA